MLVNYFCSEHRAGGLALQSTLNSLLVPGFAEQRGKLAAAFGEHWRAYMLSDRPSKEVRPKWVPGSSKLASPEKSPWTVKPFGKGLHPSLLLLWFCWQLYAGLS